MSQIIRPGSPFNNHYTISKEDIEGMISSKLPDEIVTATYVDNVISLKLRFGMTKPGWWIRVERKLYGEYHIHDSFVTHEIVQAGPEWVEKHHSLIDLAFEEARREHTKAKH